jgi:hypothetical protein
MHDLKLQSSVSLHTVSTTIMHSTSRSSSNDSSGSASVKCKRTSVRSLKTCSDFHTRVPRTMTLMVRSTFVISSLSTYVRNSTEADEINQCHLFSSHMHPPSYLQLSEGRTRTRSCCSIARLRRFNGDNRSSARWVPVDGRVGEPLESPSVELVRLPGGMDEEMR